MGKSKKQKIWLSSDLHLLHDKIINPEWSEDGHRAGFDSIEQHNEYILEKHNSVVGENDTWICLGDVFLPGAKRNQNTDVDWSMLDKFNGKKKKLILGNHDTDYRMRNFYLNYFSSITSALDLYGNILLSHYPVHPSQLEYRYILNIHGHVHKASLNEKGYFNVSMEAIDYTPICIDDVLRQVREEK